MSNPYCTIEQLPAYLDERTSGMLSNDDGKRDANRATLQVLLDTAAAELESHLAVRLSLPLAVVSLVLTQWVAWRATTLFYSRRVDRPKTIESFDTWCTNWINSYDAGSVVLPGVERKTLDVVLTGLAKKRGQPVSGLVTPPYPACDPTP